MGIARRILHEKRAWVVPLVVLALANVAALLLGVFPLRARVASTQQRATAAGAELRAATQQEQQARNTVSGKERTDHDLQRFYAEILPRDQPTARGVTYLRLAQLAREANLRFERRTVDQDRPRDSKLTRIEMAMMLSGRYEDIRHFIHALEASKEFVVISNVSLGQREEPTAPLELTLQVATYFQTPNES